MRRLVIVGGLAVLGMASVSMSLGNRDPLHGLASLQPKMERRLHHSYGDPPTLIWERYYTFRESSIALYEYLEKNQSGEWGQIAFQNGWTGEYDPVKRVLRIRENVGFSWWENLKERLEVRQQGCG